MPYFYETRTWIRPYHSKLVCVLESFRSNVRARLDFIGRDLLYRLNMDINVSIIWENWGDIIKKTRERETLPDLWDGFEYLYNEMKSLRENKGYPDHTYNP